MGSKRFNRAFHQSDIRDYNMCPRRFYLLRVLECPQDFTSTSSLLGRAYHATIESIHENGWIDESKIREVFLSTLTRELAEANPPAIWKDDEEEKMTERAILILTNYAEATKGIVVLASEKEFEVKIGKYDFAGKCDQLREHYGAEIPPADNFMVPAITEFKSSKIWSSTKPEALRRDPQMLILCYAGFKGNLFKEGPSFPIVPQMIRGSLSDYEPYKRKPKRDGLDVGDLRGPGLYIVPITLQDLTWFERAIGRTCAAIRLNIFPHRVTEDCNWCSVRLTCESEGQPEPASDAVMSRLEAAVTEEDFDGEEAGS